MIKIGDHFQDILLTIKNWNFFIKFIKLNFKIKNQQLIKILLFKKNKLMLIIRKQSKNVFLERIIINIFLINNHVLFKLQCLKMKLELLKK